MALALLDYETEAIEGRPDYPPEPAGFSIKLPNWKKSRYYAWGHPTGNNCSKDDARKILQDLWKSNHTIVAHNAKFEAAVSTEKMGLPDLPWERWHDTMVLAYLVDPHAKQIGLKELAEQRLGMPPSERDEVRDWLVGQGIVNKANKKSWGAHIAKAPGDLVGKYACGDTDRTQLIFEDLMPEVVEAGMLGAYDRERQLIPILLNNEREGVRVDLDRLAQDVEMYQAALADCAKRIYKLLGREFNLDSGDEIADALDKKYQGIQWPLTEKGARSTSKESLEIVLDGRPPLLLSLFQYYASVMTCVRNFMEPWLRVAERTNGWIHTQWNSVAQPEGGGTRTGRLSSSPNFQNIPTLKSPKFRKAIELWEKNLKKLGLPPLPQVRSYIVADTKDHVIIDRDFSQQELRVLAHFEDGDMMQAYIENPRMDLHNFAAEVLFGEVTPEGRKMTKNIAFGILYGMGLGSLAETLGVDVATAKAKKAQYLNAFPGIKEIQKELNYRGKNGLPMFTWGGRRYFAEPPRVVKGILRSFEYKLFNYLIQGSSSDVTKEAVIRYNERRKHGRLMLTVHDQVLACVHKKAWREEMKILRECMNGIELGAPLVSDGEYGYQWTQLKECE